jgi:hypothetical protein
LGLISVRKNHFEDSKCGNTKQKSFLVRQTSGSF